MPKFKMAYMPPLLIYASAGVSGITSVVGIFFIKDFLNLSAAFVASIGFWAGIPWALKMPIGFLVDRFWKLPTKISIENLCVSELLLGSMKIANINENFLYR